MPEPTTAPVTAEGLREDLYATMREVQGLTVAGAVAAALYVFIPVLERLRKAVQDAPAVAAWTGTCVECGTTIEDGDRITWRLRWSPQGPIHEECR